MNLKFVAVGLFVKDMAKMVSFYRDVLGMKTEWDGKEPNAELEADGFRLIMFGRHDFLENDVAKIRLSEWTKRHDGACL